MGNQKRKQRPPELGPVNPSKDMISSKVALSFSWVNGQTLQKSQPKSSALRDGFWALTGCSQGPLRKIGVLYWSIGGVMTLRVEHGGARLSGASKTIS